MKLFKVHSQKMKNDKVICLQDKFNDIGPDCFDGFAVECLVLAETTRFVRNYAFSGVGNCKIYLPKAIEEIEPYAFENISPSATFYCVKGSYAEQVCIEHNLNISYDVDEVSTWKEQQQRAEAEEKARLLEAYQLEQARLKAEEEAKKKAEEEARIKAEEEAKRKAEEAKKKAEEEAKIKAEEAKKKAEEEAKKKANETEKGKTPPGTRMIRVNVIDEVKGPVKETMDYATLPDGAKSLVVQNVIYMHRTYENGVVKKAYISEGIYKDKLRLFELKSGNKVVQPKPAPQKPATPGSPNTITMYIYDKANGVRTQVVDRKDFPQNEVSHIEGNEAFVHKRIIDGRVQGRFITRNEFDYLVKGGDPAKVEGGESTKVCPHCKAKISAEVKFCTNCGKPLDAPAPKPAVNASADGFKVCSKCGKKNESKYYFCVDCGNKI